MKQQVKQLTPPPPAIVSGIEAGSYPPVHPKYRIAELLRQRFGEFGYKAGITALAQHCKLKKRYTVVEWTAIPAGAEKEINHLVLFMVLQFFDLQTAEQLLTTQHKQMLKQTA